MATAAITRCLALLGATLAALAALTLHASQARAATTSLGCPGTTEYPFLKWVDPAPYTLAPGGTFEGATTTWKLTSGAKLVKGNEPFKVHAPKDGKSLSIPAGASATTPAFCVGLAYPTLRLFAVGGSLTSPLKVEVIYKTVLGTVTQPVTVVPVMSSWAPTLQTLILANATGLASLDGLTSSVQLRFTALGNGGWTIDDVYVDPWKVT